MNTLTLKQFHTLSTEKQTQFFMEGGEIAQTEPITISPSVPTKEQLEFYGNMSDEELQIITRKQVTELGATPKLGEFLLQLGIKTDNDLARAYGIDLIGTPHISGKLSPTTANAITQLLMQVLKDVVFIHLNPASTLVSKTQLDNYLDGMSEEEMNNAEAEFNEWCQPVTTQQEADDNFVTFMEEVYNHTYCDVCGNSYHNDEPCERH